MTVTTRKFTFDDFFDFDRQPEVAPEVQDAPPPSPLFSEAELAEARAAGFEEGRMQALLDHERSDANRLAAAVERIADGMVALSQAETARNRNFQSVALDVALATVRKLMPELARRFGQNEIESVVVESLGEQHDEPRLVIRVPDAAFEPLAGRIESLAAKRGYAGKTVILADAALAPADCRIEWADGGVERLAERTLGDIAAAIVRLSHVGEANAQQDFDSSN